MRLKLAGLLVVCILLSLCTVGCTESDEEWFDEEEELTAGDRISLVLDTVTMGGALPFGAKVEYNIRGDGTETASLTVVIDGGVDVSSYESSIDWYDSNSDSDYFTIDYFTID